MNSSLTDKSDSSFTNSIIQLCIKFVNTGVKPEYNYWIKNRIRILNGVCGVSIIVFLIYAIVCIKPMINKDTEYDYGFILSLAALVLYTLFIFMNKINLNNISCHLFTLFNIALYSLLFITQSKLSAVEYFLFPASVSCMLFFTDIRILIGYVLLTMGSFFTGKYFHGGVQPIEIKPEAIPMFIMDNLCTFLFLFIIVNYFKKQNIKQESILEIRNQKLTEEKEKSDTLLLNILPYEIAEELKETGAAKARSFPMVTVMFTDFKDFTSYTEKMNPDELVKSINHYFSEFDYIISKYHIEKIKTIGDSYMCADGLSDESGNNAANVIRAALEIQNFISNHKKEKIVKGEPYFELRLGIHTGPVVAGIVGIKKFAYDIWGDTVNMASRMESGGEVGKVNISGASYNLVKDKFVCSYRGKINTKSKGDIEMYFVEKELTD